MRDLPYYALLWLGRILYAALLILSAPIWLPILALIIAVSHEEPAPPRSGGDQ